MGTEHILPLMAGKNPTLLKTDGTDGPLPETTPGRFSSGEGGAKLIKLSDGTSVIMVVHDSFLSHTDPFYYSVSADDTKLMINQNGSSNGKAVIDFISKSQPLNPHNDH